MNRFEPRARGRDDRRRPIAVPAILTHGIPAILTHGIGSKRGALFDVGACASADDSGPEADAFRTARETLRAPVLAAPAMLALRPPAGRLKGRAGVGPAA